jgi:hypothetical protein
MYIILQLFQQLLGNIIQVLYIYIPVRVTIHLYIFFYTVEKVSQFMALVLHCNIYI